VNGVRIPKAGPGGSCQSVRKALGENRHGFEYAVPSFADSSKLKVTLNLSERCLSVRGVMRPSCQSVQRESVPELDTCSGEESVAFAKRFK